MPPQSSNTYTLPSKPTKAPLFAAIILGVLFVVALVFGIWAYMGRQDYKNNADAKAAAAAATAAKSQTTKDQADFAQQLKAPYKTYTGSATYGSITFNYPKTWSAYVDETGNDEPINGYFHPNVVPGVQSGTAFALRLELVNQSYSDVIAQFQPSVTNGTVKASAYTPPKLQGVNNVQTGTRLDGNIGSDSQVSGSMVVVKVRDKTLKVYTLSNDYLSDFNNIILPSLTFNP